MLCALLELAVLPGRLIYNAPRYRSVAGLRGSWRITTGTREFEESAILLRPRLWKNIQSFQPTPSPPLHRGLNRILTQFHVV